MLPWLFAIRAGMFMGISQLLRPNASLSPLGTTSAFMPYRGRGGEIAVVSARADYVGNHPAWVISHSEHLRTAEIQRLREHMP